MSLNEAQKTAVSHKEGPCMVLAGPGSGKTTVITKRIAHLLDVCEVDPNTILVVTFSKAAAKEMKERFQRLYLNRQIPVTFGTFHGIFYGILKWAYKMSASNILSEEEKYQILRQVIEQLNLDLDDEKEFYQGISSEISNVKNNRILLDNYQAVQCDNHIFQAVLRGYEEEKKIRKKIDFDDMLVMTYQLFQARPDILKLWQNRFHYILVDEFQDINQIQYDVIRMLAAPQNNLFVVGDDDQSIYQFRGARPEIMLGLERDFPNVKKVILSQNYRSTKAIVRCSKRLIQKNQKRYQKEFVTLNEQGDTVHIQETRTPVEESRYVAKKILEARDRGIPLSEIAILFRTNMEARAMVETCMEYNIPYQMKEHVPNLYEHFIGKDLLAYMKMALGDRSRTFFLKIMNRPNRYISRKCIEEKKVSFEKLRGLFREKEWMQDRIDQFELDLRIIQRMAPYGAIQYIRKHVGYDIFLQEYAALRKIKLEELEEILHEIEESAKQYKDIESWFTHIEEYGEALRQQSEWKKEQTDAVSFMTMHGAKGLEFQMVFVIGSNEGITPYKKAETMDELEEERRLFYVAMTRAKKKLILTYTTEKNGKKMEVSRFINEILQ